MNWYDVLEVSHSASPQVIRAAYKSLMQRYHPDKAVVDAPPSDAQRATQLAQAYAVLSDPGQRLVYDQQLQGRVAVASATPTARAPQFHRPVQGATPKRSHFPIVGWLGLCGLVLLGGLAFKKLLPSPSTATTAATGTSTLAAAPSQAGRRVHLPGLVVPVRAQSDAMAGEPHNLTIPSVTFELGPWQAERSAWRLGQASTVDALQAALADVGYEALIAPNGEATLTRALQDAANTVLGPPTLPPARNSNTGSVLLYGVQSVVLPNAFSVH